MQAESCSFFGTKETIAVKFQTCTSFLQYCIISGQYGIESDDSKVMLSFCTVSDSFCLLNVIVLMSICYHYI